MKIGEVLIIKPGWNNDPDYQISILNNNFACSQDSIGYVKTIKRDQTNVEYTLAGVPYLTGNNWRPLYEFSIDINVNQMVLDNIIALREEHTNKLIKSRFTDHRINENNTLLLVDGRISDESSSIERGKASFLETFYYYGPNKSLLSEERVPKWSIDSIWYVYQVFIKSISYNWLLSHQGINYYTAKLELVEMWITPPGFYLYYYNNKKIVEENLLI